mmetsp:Transcript_8832/g.24826  ORF Transcript_8832/g.24826 Transcript_8832/m.24826 type:complete len:356 (+) Transcript_8832:98-1165(+)|eukprot:CAMPEP_0119130988 /NCGR_PEP_ID=MMETSP1310-20130426/9152_1 /TAXON_ID=464262 /ORGANISM="Genus nov. species nov., Strain RCC2339" /LENGTH=355 /DNA_ID=CAMNT_0007121537 /DNA_START=79 /DNA_END=1146 /DNA_ORIENTATION=+
MSVSVKDGVLSLAQSISCHAWNGDFSRLAFCPNDNSVHIYKKTGNDYEREHVLTEHDQTVTSIAWASNSNTLLTCSHDRNAYVWVEQDGTWKPTLVILRINRAALQVKWSPNEDKFAVASGAKCVSVCHYEEDNDWWVSKHIKKHDSTVTSVDFHPGNILVATASTDGKVRVFSAFIKGMDKRPEYTPFGKRVPFNSEVLGEYEANGWVHSVRWSPDGNQLAFCSHDSTLTVVDVTQGAPGIVQTVKTQELPLCDIFWVNDSKIIGAGHSCRPFIFENQNGTWAETQKLDDKKGGPQDNKRSAFSIFQNKDKMGQDNNVKTLNTKHKNAITCIQRGPNNQISTSSLDGQLVFWNV